MHLLLRPLLVLRLLLWLLHRLLSSCFIVDARVPNPAKGPSLPSSLL